MVSHDKEYHSHGCHGISWVTYLQVAVDDGDKHISMNQQKSI